MHDRDGMPDPDPRYPRVREGDPAARLPYFDVATLLGGADPDPLYVEEDPPRSGAILSYGCLAFLALAFAVFLVAVAVGGAK